MPGTKHPSKPSNALEALKADQIIDLGSLISRATVAALPIRARNNFGTPLAHWQNLKPLEPISINKIKQPKNPRSDDQKIQRNETDQHAGDYWNRNKINHRLGGQIDTDNHPQNQAGDEIRARYLEDRVENENRVQSC